MWSHLPHGCWMRLREAQAVGNDQSRAEVSKACHMIQSNRQVCLATILSPHLCVVPDELLRWLDGNIYSPQRIPFLRSKREELYFLWSTSLWVLSRLNTNSCQLDRSCDALCCRLTLKSVNTRCLITIACSHLDQPQFLYRYTSTLQVKSDGLKSPVNKVKNLKFLYTTIPDFYDTWCQNIVYYSPNSGEGSQNLAKLSLSFMSSSFSDSYFAPT